MGDLKIPDDANLSPGGEYEFGPEHTGTMSELSGSIVFVSIATILFSAFNILLGLAHAAHQTVSALFEVAGGVLGLVVGFWLLHAANALDRVVKTEGSDITHLMDALGQLKKVFKLQAVLMALQCLFLIVVLVAALG